MKTRSNSSSSSSSCCSVVVCNVYDWWNTVQRELEETVHRMELENTRLDMALQHERDKSKQLNRECTDSRQVCDVCLLSRIHAEVLDRTWTWWTRGSVSIGVHRPSGYWWPTLSVLSFRVDALPLHISSLHYVFSHSLLALPRMFVPSVTKFYFHVASYHLTQWQLMDMSWL